MLQPLSTAVATPRPLPTPRPTPSSHRACVQVDSVREHEFFGDASITKTPTAPASAVAADVTATVLVMSK